MQCPRVSRCHDGDFGEPSPKGTIRPEGFSTSALSDPVEKRFFPYRKGAELEDNAKTPISAARAGVAFWMRPRRPPSRFEVSWRAWRNWLL